MPQHDNPAIGHLLVRYDEELLAVHRALLQMGAKVVGQVKDALSALIEQDATLAKTVVDRDREIDRLEVAIDDELVKVLARRAPVARDLRLIIAISKAVTDLERMGDKAVKIADRGLQFLQTPSGPHLPDALYDGIRRFGQTAVLVLEEVMRSFASFDLARAERVLRHIAMMEKGFQGSLRQLIDLVWREAAERTNPIGMILVIQSLDRIVDHSENIAEHLVFLIRGEDIRHTEL